MDAIIVVASHYNPLPRIKNYISRTHKSKRLRLNGRSGRKNNFELSGLCQTDCPGQDVPNHALSQTGQIFAWKILLSRIFRFFWLCSSRKEKRLRWLQRNEGRNKGREELLAEELSTICEEECISLFAVFMFAKWSEYYMNWKIFFLVGVYVIFLTLLQGGWVYPHFWNIT